MSAQDMRPEEGTILASGIAQVQATAPDSFTVGLSTDGRTVEGGLTYDRHWTNGWGATAYLKGWWHDAAVIPGTKAGGAAGVGIVKKF